MSGIFGILRLDGAPATESDLRPMAEANPTRGPDGTFFHVAGGFAAGICRLDTTPEAPFETLPLVDPDTGIVVVADVRLDNRDELLAALLPDAPAERTGDTALIAAAWLRWGEDCPVHLVGDFAFCIFDPRTQTLFGARDRLGVKPFNYASLDGRAFLFGTDDIAVAAHPLCPRDINEERFADHLTGLFEGAEIEATFFKAVKRLPAAHVLTMRNGQLRIRRYWTFEPPEELKLDSDEAYAEAFLEVFERAVQRRLRGGPIVGSMLSGGMDSGAVCAVAAPLFKAATGAQFKTFSAIDSGNPDCVETAHALASARFLDVNAQFVDLAKPEEWVEPVSQGFLRMGSPFDCHMNLVRAVCQRARSAGCKVLLSGVNSDVILHASGMVARAIRAGEWQRARQIHTEDPFENRPFWRVAIMAKIPTVVRRSIRPLRRLLEIFQIARQSHVAMTRAALLALFRRSSKFDLFSIDDEWVNAQRSSVAAISHPNSVVASERYDRVAAESGMEIRDPFADMDLLAFCASLPSDQKMANGFRKLVLRRAMRSRLPEKVLKRISKEHLGHLFSGATFKQLREVNILLTTDMLGVLIRLPQCDTDAMESSASEYGGYWLGLEWWLARVTGKTRPAAVVRKRDENHDGCKA